MAQSIVGQLKDALPPGGYLALNDGIEEPGASAALEQYNESGAVPFRLRRPEHILRFFDGLDLIAPGMVSIQDWRPDHTPFGNATPVPAMGGVAKKP